MKTHGWIILICAYLLLGGVLPASHAVVSTNITSSGLGTLVNGGASCASACTITGGTLSSSGSNLFHSFGLFNVGTLDIATFSVNTGVANIIGRVTGGQISNIDGTLRVTWAGSGLLSNANLYLLNPAGVFFGANARLDTAGSFHVSTADYLKFTDGQRFSLSTTDSQATLLTTSPAAFGFLGSNPAAITVQGSTLAVPTGQTLSVVGGDITMTGGILSAPSGRINVASVQGQPGEVLVANSQDAFGAGQIQLSAGARVDVSGNQGGTVVIRGGRLMMDSSAIVANTTGSANGDAIGVDVKVRDQLVITNSLNVTNNFLGTLLGGILGITADSFGAGTAGAVTITSGSLQMENAGLSGSRVLIGSRAFSSGAGGNVDITTGTLQMTGGNLISTSTAGGGQGGTLTVHATGSVTISGGTVVGGPAIGLVSNASSTGPAGQVLVSAPTVTLTDGAEISSSAQGAGHGGSVTVTATESITIARPSSDGFLGGVFSNARGSGDAGQVLVSAPSLIMADSAIQSNTTTGPGNAGVVTVTVGRLSLTEGAQIASSTFGTGDGGNVAITASDSITIAGRSSNGFPSGVFASSGTPGHNAVTGNAGQIAVSASTISITGGGKISSTANEVGRGGTVSVTAGAINIADPGSGLFTQGNTGSGGNILLSAGNVELTNGAIISAKSTGTGNAGDITIQANGLFRMHDSSVTTNAPLASGGNITIRAQSMIVDPSQIIASAGINGGNIFLGATDVLLISPDSVIDASGTLGASGSINISSPVTNLSGTLAPLSQEFLQAGALLRARCAARQRGKSSSFVVTGRDGLPPAPGGVLPSPLLLAGPAGAPQGLSLPMPALPSQLVALNTSARTPEQGCAP